MRSARSSWLEARAGCCRFRRAASILAHLHLHHPHIHSRTHPQHTMTHDHYADSVSLHTQCHTRRFHSLRLSLHHCIYTHGVSLFHTGPRTPLPLPAVVSQHAWYLFLLQGSHPSLGRPTHGVFLFFFRVPTLLLAGRSFFLLASHCAARRARQRARTAVLSFCLLRVAPRAAALARRMMHHAPCMHACPLVQPPTTDGRTTRRAVRRRG